MKQQKVESVKQNVVEKATVKVIFVLNQSSFMDLAHLSPFGACTTNTKNFYERISSWLPKVLWMLPNGLNSQKNNQN